MGRARTCDPTAGFSVDQVLAGFLRLYTIEDGHLVPNLDAQHKLPACPITLAPFVDPVLLEDGFVYEQAAIVQWLERHPNAPCTNVEVRNLRVLRLEPFRALVSKLLEERRDCIHSGWRIQLLKAEQEADCHSTPVFMRCDRVEHAIDSCMVEASELEAGLKAARRTATRLRALGAELRCRQLNSVKLQRAVRCWLARRRLQNARALLKLVRSNMQVLVARQRLACLRLWRLFAVLRIQRWWRRQRSRRKSLKRRAKRAKRKLARQLKKETIKALREETDEEMNPNMMRAGVQVRVVETDTQDQQFTGMVGICESWNAQMDRWNVRLRNDDVVVIHPICLERYRGVDPEPPAPSQ